LVCSFHGLVSCLSSEEGERDFKLTDRCGEDDETSPVVLDKLAHFDGTVDSRKK
jgi:hypothetical protein